MVKEIKENNMDEALASKLAVVDFSASWCGPCKMLAPVLEDISNAFEGKVDFYGADVDENMRLARDYMVRSVPTVIILKDGEHVDTSIGVVSKSELSALISKHL